MLGFIIAVGGGVLVPMLEDPVGQTVSDQLRKFMPVEVGEARIIALLAVLIAVALLSALFGSGSILGVAVGVTLGYFATRLVTIVKKAVDGKPD
jgi:ABC-type microcin C transport system permease subunit YejE